MRGERELEWGRREREFGAHLPWLAYMGEVTGAEGVIREARGWDALWGWGDWGVRFLTNAKHHIDNSWRHTGSCTLPSLHLQHLSTPPRKTPSLSFFCNANFFGGGPRPSFSGPVSGPSPVYTTRQTNRNKQGEAGMETGRVQRSAGQSVIHASLIETEI